MEKFELEEVANELINVKKSIDGLQEKEKVLKKKLEPHVGLAVPLLLSDGKIYFYSEKMAKSFDRSEVLEFVEKHYGKEAARALDIECTRKKIIAKRLHVKTWDDNK